MRNGCLPQWLRSFVAVLLAAAISGGMGCAQSEKSSPASPKIEIKGEPPYYNLKVGVASYSLRQFPLDEAIRMTKELGVQYISLKSYHLDLKSTKEELQEAARKIQEADLELVSCGVITVPKDLPDMRGAFEYARDAGIPMIVASFPPEDLPAIEKLVKEFDIKVAIHNHGPGDTKFPSALDAYAKVQPFDQRIGVCLDVGHAARLGENEVELVYQVKDRLLDVHIKDVDKRAKEGKTVEMGRGVIDLPGLVKALIDVGYTGHVNLEFEKGAANPMPGMQESFLYLRNLMGDLAAQ